VKQFLVDAEEIDVDMANKTFIVHYGIDLNNIPVARDIDLRFKKYIQVGTLSRLEEQKDLTTLIAAIKMVTEKYSNVRLVIHGEGSKREALIELRSMLSLERSVEILGKTDQVESFFANCDIFVLTSKYEGFGLVLLESMYYGTPLLASNSTAALEVLKGSENLLFQIGDARGLANKIVALIECPKIIENNVESCRRILHYYDIAIARDEIEKLYV
jgi:glycosyltransferase involved in cell wall biosynthesis